MRKSIVIIIISTMAGITVQSQTDVRAIQDIQTVLAYYLDGGTNGDSVMFSKSFLPDGQMRFMEKDKVMNVSLKDFTGGFRNTGIKQQNVKTRIDNIQVFGDAASAKLTLEFPTMYFHDFMSLLKTKDGWKIVSKIFYGENKSK